MSENQTSVWKVMTNWICRELHCSISSVSIYYTAESDIQGKSHDHWNFSRASVVQFRACRYVMSLHRSSVWKFMTIWIYQVLLFFNFERLDILCPQIRHPCEKSWPFEFLESFFCSISRIYINYVPESDIRAKSYDHRNFSRASVVLFRASRYIMSLNREKSDNHWNSSWAFIFHFRASRWVMSLYRTTE